jgi:hypothetical protein
MQEKVKLHGEAMIIEKLERPTDLVAYDEKVEKEGYIIIAPSEQRGNHHVLDLPQGGAVKFYKNKQGQRFFECSTQTQVRCLAGHRHAPFAVAPNTLYELDIQQEYDHFLQNTRNVAD